jgi:hypothetical protein
MSDARPEKEVRYIIMVDSTTFEGDMIPGVFVDESQNLPDGNHIVY